MVVVINSDGIISGNTTDKNQFSRMKKLLYYDQFIACDMNEKQDLGTADHSLHGNMGKPFRENGRNKLNELVARSIQWLQLGLAALYLWGESCDLHQG